MTARFDVVIVGYHNGEQIAECVEAARALPEVGDVVVVDHGRDATGTVAERCGARVLRDPTNPGFGAGQNRGIAETTAPIVLLLNPDAVVRPDGISAGLALLDARPTVGAVQGAVVNRATGGPERSAGRELGPVHLVGRAVGARRLLGAGVVRSIGRRIGVLADHVDRVPEGPTEVETLAATAVLVRRDALVGIGGFDEAYFLYGEDLDLCRRLRRAGWTLVALPTPVAWHESGGSAASVTARELTWWRGTLAFAARWWGTGPWCLGLLAATLAWMRIAVREPETARRAWRELVRGPIGDRCRAQGSERSSVLRSIEVSAGSATTS